ncbi:MAG TPA: hydrogenase formation protein HypD [Candidatus Faecimorpha stercoravium]|nr:hydrogenase formation protein HypD [Candidatus Faecimorpha stercoravium]
MTRPIDHVLSRLVQYDGAPIRLMEVCGTQTAEISRHGIRHLLPPGIQMISGPGCPVCVTVTAYVDRLVWLSRQENTTVVSFGDLFRVPGSRESLSEAKASGGHAVMVYAPSQMLTMARQQPDHQFVFAAVGFETTAPIYAGMIRRAKEEGLQNLKFLTSLKTMPAALRWICDHEPDIHGFLAPGHVCAVTGIQDYEQIAKEYGIPFVVSGFSAQELLAAIYALVCLQGKGELRNFYPSVVRPEGNPMAQSAVQEVFEPCGAAWRGIGRIEGSGLRLREEYREFDALSDGLDEDVGKNQHCQCARVLLGEILPTECPLFGTACTPATPQGACMVSAEGSCFHYYTSERGR